jgi:hypothetical protein
MTWYYRVLFLGLAAWCIWNLVTNDKYYAVFAQERPETRIPTWLGRVGTGIGAIVFIWLAFRR